MTQMVPLKASLVAVAIGTGFSAQVEAQVATDSTLGMPASISGPHYKLPSSLGKQVGGNLFHSFATFNLVHGERATFTGPSGIANVISRVTGASASSIDGIIQSKITGANVYLINPKGIVFGPNASLDLSGSFHASSADHIKLGGNGRFDASNPAASVLTSAAPEAFGFLGPSAATISVQGSSFSLPKGASVSLVGGAVDVANATLSTTGGDIRVIGMAGAGEVAFAPGGVASTAAARANIAIERSELRTEGSDIAPGRIVIRGGAIRVVDSHIVSTNSSGAAAPPISLSGTGDVVVARSTVESFSDGDGAGADLVFAGANVRIEQASILGTQTSGNGRSGAVDMTASAAVSVVSTSADSDYVYLYTYTEGAGGSGPIRLSADRIELRAPSVYTQTAGAGDLGAITMSARDVHLAEGAWIASYSEPGAGGRTSAIEISARERIHLGGVDWNGYKAEIYTQLEGSGHAGNIVLKAPTILVMGGNIESASFGPANSGSVRVEGDVVRFIAGDGAHARAASITGSGSSGDGGNVEIAASRAFELNGNGFLGDWTHIVTATEGSGRGGDIVIKSPSVVIDRGTLFARTRFGTGSPGGIEVVADTITLRNEGGIGSVTEGNRKGSSVRIDTGVLEAADTSGIGADSIASGDAGSVTINAQRVRLTGASGFGVSSSGSGNAGDLVLNIGESFEMSERTVGTYQDLGGGGPRGQPVWPGGLTVAASGSGNAGILSLRAPTILLDGARIMSTARGAGRGGQVQIRADDMIMRSGAQVDATTAKGSSGDAGSIDVQVTGRFEISGLSQIDGAFSGLYAQTEGHGRGGNIAVTADDLMLDRGLIRSSTAGPGSAGAIKIRGGKVTLANGGWIDAGTAPGSTGAGGSIDLAASRSLTVRGTDQSPIVPTRLETEGLKISPGTPGRLQGRFSSTVSSDTTGAGAGGNVTLIAPQIVIDDGGRVTANSSGAGTAGSLFVTANPGWLRVYDGFITTRAESSDGGNITMVAGNGVRLKGAEISTSVGGGSGSGGNISIDPPFVILQDARVAANALAGAGGNITLIGDYFFITPGSTIEASSQLGLPGRVQISALQNHAVSGLPALSAQFFDATGLLREACTGRGGSVSSRLVDVGRGGVTGTPSSYASSRYFHDEPVPAPQASERGSMTRSAQPERSVLLAGICPF